MINQRDKQKTEEITSQNTKGTRIIRAERNKSETN